MRKILEVDSKTYFYKKGLELILTKHYAQRKPSISKMFVLLEGETIIGVITYGKPASNPLCEGVCGKEYKDLVYELNRLLILKKEPNLLSWFVASTLRELKKHKWIIVSYSDRAMNHNGYIYQATNFLYTGCTKERTDKYMPGGKHPRHYTDEFKHLRKVRSPKNRYVFFTDKKMSNKLLYPILDYPKYPNENYILGERQKQLIVNTETGERFYE